MSNEMLSQDEIDALLRGSNDGSLVTSDLDTTDNYLSEMEKDALGEVGNISFGSSATALSTLLNQKVDITTPEVSVVLKHKLSEEFPQPNVAIQVSYTQGFSGTNLLVIKQNDAAIIADLMLGGDGKKPADLMGEIQMSAVQEAMNQMMGSAATSMSTIFSKRVDISPPSIDLLDMLHGTGTDKLPNDDKLVKISFRLKIGNLIDSNIMQLLPLDFAKGLVYELLNPISEPIQEVNVPPQTAEKLQESYYQEPQYNQPTQNQMDHSAQQSNMVQTPYGFESREQPLNQQNYSGNHSFGVTPVNQPTGPQHFGSANPLGVQPNVQPALFSNFEPYPIQEPESKNLNMLLDIPLQVTVELGRTKRSVKEILELSQGSIIELDKLAGEPVDILINSRLIAKGEVVVIEENFGVRVTDIISQSDRLKKLK
ncbi:flagellar motor switch phosphatase FliY [Niallia endozanthoxylica]|uniref:Flagellar motor switch phosphatase FliY n=1 Tax=Niallia endozanthoxylica TaxID=2036016 RepID=A0A5J5HVB3_9BACI|nr:flagellar motor switch phosphatase FliY [Niallia endozanthoxylica]KAA9025867.1 flagellar motor switch phosphatase FliY [Niallia endozanthoxylica]